MLTRLHIRNYAIIDELAIDFSASLNIITGETGAGKSILMGALNLILGGRLEANPLRDPEKKCIVEGWFTVGSTQRLSDFFSVNDLDQDEEIVIRREVSGSGKSRAFINDTPVNLGQLKSLSHLLVDLHQQFDTLELNSSEFQREVLDAYAGNTSILEKLKTEYNRYREVSRKLEELKEQQTKANQEQDYNQFLFDELSELSLVPGELENLEAELKLLSNAEKIKLQLSAVYSELTETDTPLVQQAKALQNRLKALYEYHPDIEALSARMGAALIELQDVSEELQRIDEAVVFDEEKIDLINTRLSLGYKLIRKHSVADTAGLLRIQQELQEKLGRIQDISVAVGQLEKQSAELHAICLATAQTVSAQRLSATKPFSDRINKLLAQVGMPNARLKINLLPSQLSATGTDDTQFLFDANKSSQFAPLSKVASGGELSRLMLSIKSLVASKLELPTLIFDEIDSGISGEAAKQVGMIMKDLSAAHQLIAITHQAQIAARADAHYFVFKELKGDKIVTGIRLLSKEERIVAIAQMMSGESPSTAALANAREMVSN